MLVIGDSWASKGRLDAGGAQAIGGRFCSLGFSGRTAHEIAANLRALPQDRLAIVGRPKTVLLLVGVNDVVQHIGPARYAAGVRELTEAADQFGDDIRVVEIPWTNPGVPAKSVPSWGKRLLNRYVNDGGRKDVTAEYRRAVPAEIGYDDFIPSYAGYEDRYKDGLHLTTAEFGRLGRYLGQAIAKTDGDASAVADAGKDGA